MALRMTDNDAAKADFTDLDRIVMECLCSAPESLKLVVFVLLYLPLLCNVTCS